MKKAITLIFIFIIAVLVGRFLSPFFAWFLGLPLGVFGGLYLALLVICVLLWLKYILKQPKQPLLHTGQTFDIGDFKYSNLFRISFGLIVGFVWFCTIMYDIPYQISDEKYEDDFVITWKDKKLNCFGLEYTEKEEFVIDPDIYKAKTEEQQRENKKENTNSNSSTYSYPAAPTYQDPYPAGGGYNGGYNPYESSTIENTPRQKTKVRNDCRYCEDGEIIQHDYVPTFGVDGPRVYCSKCNQSWSPGTVHAHHQCNYCNGRGYTEYEY